jgi:hypothetical protein
MCLVLGKWIIKAIMGRTAKAGIQSHQKSKPAIIADRRSCHSSLVDDPPAQLAIISFSLM